MPNVQIKQHFWKLDKIWWHCDKNLVDDF